MKLLKDISEIDKNEKVGLLIGNFDGVHLGHKKLIQDTINQCQDIGIKLLVVSFVPHPIQILKPKDNFFINTYEERRDLLSLEGVDYFLEIGFDRDLSTLFPKDFLDKYIFKNGIIQKFFLGYDFVFGANKEGDSAFVEKYCKQKSISFSLEKKFSSTVGNVSSSVVRDAISLGDIVKVNTLLDRKFFITGRVIKGEGRGKQIGFPTANLDYLAKRIVPSKGVYITQTKIADSLYNSVTNIGNNPTFKSDLDISVETHLIDFDRDIYGEEAEVRFIKRLRDEVKFDSVNQLVDQINIDVNKARKYFKC